MEIVTSETLSLDRWRKIMIWISATVISLFCVLAIYIGTVENQE